MSFFQSTNLLQNLNLHHDNTVDSAEYSGKQQARLQGLRTKSSIANLVHFVRNPIANLGEVVEHWHDTSTDEERVWKQQQDDKKQLLYLKLRNATEYKDWQAAATELDEIEENNDWKSVFESPDYDAALVEARLKQLDEARISCDVGRMLFLIRTSLTRGLGAMGNLKLYKHTHIGTKDLIERYITSAMETLDALLGVSARCKCDGLESKYMLEQVLSTRQAFGRSALLLSGGATFGMNHIGVLKALWEAHLLPRIISGASAGSIVGAVLCTRTDEEIPDLMASFCSGDLAVFDEDGNEDGILRKVARFLKHGALFDISHLIRVMRDLLGEMTFQEAYNRTRKILNICVSSASLYELPRLLNYVTAPNVLIWSAVAASCSVPFVFSAASILAKDPKTGDAVPWNPSPQRWIDGSVDNDLPMTRLAEMFNVNHFIVSQVNPHVIPFLIKDEDSIAQEAQQSTPTVGSGPTWLDSITHLAKGEALHRMHILSELGIFPNTLTKAVSVLSQKYSGDITIFPEISYTDFPTMLSNPTPEFMQAAMLCGERATWPKLSRIRNHCAIELALDDAVQKLRARVVFSPSQVNLRLSTTSRSNSDMRRGARVKGIAKNRPLSQNAAVDFFGSKHTHHNSKSGRPRSQPHKKTQSITTVSTQPDNTSRSYSNVSEHIAPNVLPLNPRILHDLTSSGADTSNLTTSSSSSSLSFSSPTESPTSPTSPSSQPLYSASQPVTPSHHHHHQFPSSTFPMSQMKPNPTSSSALSMTPKTKLAAPGTLESRYKRLFHHRSPREQSLAKDKTSGGRSSAGAAGVDGKPTSPPVAGGMKRNWVLEIDISGAKNMISRKKKGGSGSESGR